METGVTGVHQLSLTTFVVPATCGWNEVKLDDRAPFTSPARLRTPISIAVRMRCVCVQRAGAMQSIFVPFWLGGRCAGVTGCVCGQRGGTRKAIVARS